MLGQRRVTVCAVIVCLMAGFAARGEKAMVSPERLSRLPITFDEACDESTLKAKVVSDVEIDHPDFPGRSMRLLTVRYDSHSWKDGAWTGRFKMYLPSPIADEHKGCVAFCPGGVGERAPREIDMEHDLHAGTALLMGIPVCTIPQPGEKHLGRDEIHRISDAAIERLLETHDMGWICDFPYVALNMRAATAAGSVLGSSTSKIVLMGTSITGRYAFQTATFDPRVVGVLATGSDGHATRPTFEQVHASLRSIHNRYKQHLPEGQTGDDTAYDRLADASDEFKRETVAYSSRGADAANLQGTILQINGSSDHAVTHLKAGEYMDQLPVAHHFAQAPNYPHGCAAKVHLDGFRMLIDHCFNDRPLTRISEPEYKWAPDSALEVSVTTQGKPEVRSAAVYWFQSGEKRFFAPGFASKFREIEHVTNAKLKRVEMKQSRDGVYATTIRPNRDGGDSIIIYTTVEDFAGRTAGHVSSPISWLTRPGLRDSID